MKVLFRKQIGKFLLVVVMLVALLSGSLPAGSLAATIDFPADVRSVVPESELVELMYLTAYSRSAPLLAHIDALQEILVPAMADVEALMGEKTPKLPDFVKMRADYIAKLEAIKQAKTVAEAEKLISDLETEGQRIGTVLQGVQDDTRVIEPELQAQGQQTEAQIREKIQPELDAQVQKINDDINSIVQSRVEQEREKLQPLFMAQGLLMVKKLDTSAIQAQIDAEIARFTQELTAEMDALGKQRGAELQTWVESRVAELTEEYAAPFLKIRDSFADMSTRIETTAAEKMMEYHTYEERYLAKKTEIISRAMDQQHEKALEQIKAHASDFELARQAGKDFPTMEEFLVEFQRNWDIFKQKLVASDSEAEVNNAITEFSGFWKEKQAEMESLRVGSTAELLKMIINEIKTRNVEEKLAAGRQETLDSIAKLKELRDSNNITPEETKSLDKANTLLSLIDEAQNMVTEIKATTSGEDIQKLIKLKDRFVLLLQEIEQTSSNMVITDKGYLASDVPQNIPTAVVGVTG